MNGSIGPEICMCVNFALSANFPKCYCVDKLLEQILFPMK